MRQLGLEQVESRDVMAAGALASLGQGLLTSPTQGVRTESVDNNETITVHSQSLNYHLVPAAGQDGIWKSTTGRIGSIAVDPSDPSGNTVYNTSQKGIIAVLIGL